MSHLTAQDYNEVGKVLRSFTCYACNGFQYLKPAYFSLHQDMAICKDCFHIPAEVTNLRITKPGQHEVLVSIKDFYAGSMRDLKGWIKAAFNTESEDVAATKLQVTYTEVWKEHYRRITGENWV